MKQCMDSENLHLRLKKIIGQVQAIDRMIDEDVAVESCCDIYSEEDIYLLTACAVLLFI